MKLSPPASGWQRKKKGLVGGELLAPISGIALVLVSLIVCSYFLLVIPEYKKTIFIIQFIIFIWGTFLLYLSQVRIKHNLLIPLSHLRNWAIRMRGGNLSAQIPVPDHGEFAKLAKDINDLGESLRSLSREMDEKVTQQTERLEQKTRSLQILYQVAASSNDTRDVENLLTRHLVTMADIIQAKFATVRLINDNHQLRLIGTIGFNIENLSNEKYVPIEHCLCALNFQEYVIQCGIDKRFCGNLLGDKILDFCKNEMQAIALPLQYQGRTLGIYTFFIEKGTWSNNDEAVKILTTICQHLSFAIEKSRLENESKRITIMQERTMLAHELHDSLAQTLASLRFHVKFLEIALQQTDTQKAQSETQQIRDGLDEANSELRELLANFRVQLDERGLIPATETLINRLKSDTGVAIFFQNECSELNLTPVIEIQVLHIIQEALTNIRKHSKANNVRVLIRCDGENCYHILVEDDGIGIELNNLEAQPGEHVGLSIMHERAKRINANLSIESERGEGTRIELDFSTLENSD